MPQRTCVGCRQVLAKRSLVRLVRTENGVVLDPSGKMNGRGAYLHQLRSCWERALKGALAHALKAELSESDRKNLEEVMNGLPDEHGDAE
ncbi:MAG TPA: YlxR family protein [Anaerolineaceae bacterium]|nr:YlxR family protein [Anaerolineaceae bacterium]HPN54084.1 YlxR family protein [Anaerolineaceae bacterium]